MSYQNARTTDKYVKVRKQAEKAPENEVRIKAVPRIGRYISYAATLLLEKHLDIIILKASGNAAKSACQIAEILRHRIVGLHQLNLLKTVSVTDEYEPKEEGLDRVVVERQLAVLEIHLSLKDSAFDTKNVGYQQPLPKDQVQEEDLKNLLEGRKRGGDGERPRSGGRGNRRGYRRGGYSGNRGGGRRYGDRREGGERREYSGERRQGGYRERRDDNRDYKDRRDDNRDYKDRRDNRDNRDYKDRRDDNRDNRDYKDRRDNRDNRDNRERRDDNRDYKGEKRDNRDYKDNRDNRQGGDRRN